MLGYSWESQVASVVVGLAILLGMRVVRDRAHVAACVCSCVFDAMICVCAGAYLESTSSTS